MGIADRIATVRTCRASTFRMVGGSGRNMGSPCGMEVVWTWAAHVGWRWSGHGQPMWDVNGLYVGNPCGIGNGLEVGSPYGMEVV